MKALGILLSLALTACGATDGQIKEAIRKDPKIVFQAIEDNPAEFMDAVNRAVKVAQEKQYEGRIAEVREQREKDMKEPRKPELDPKRRMNGSPTGQIVLVEYGDLQCPACLAGHPGVRKFLEVHKKDVQYYFKNMPLDMHPMARPAAEAYEAIFLQNPAQAQTFFHWVFDNQKKLSDKGFLREAIMLSGADPAKVERDKKSDIVQKRIAADMAEFEKMKFTGTPSLILNGVALEGAQRYEDLEQALAMTQLKKIK